MLDFGEFEAISFDCYGTLIDWEQGIVGCLQPILQARGINVENESLLAIYADAEAAIEQKAFNEYIPYREVLRLVTARIARKLGFEPTDAEQTALAESIADWAAFPDTVESLRALKRRFRLAIISNIDDDLFEKSARHLLVEWDWAITAQQSRAYKPSELMFHYALEQIGLPKEKILHIAQSIYHDIVPASRLGQTAIRINRRGGKSGFGATPPAQGKPAMEFPDLRSLVSFIDS